MSNPVVKLIVKALSAIAGIILAQISDYISSEQFRNQVKVVIKKMVESIVKIVMKEKNQPIK